MIKDPSLTKMPLKLPAEISSKGLPSKRPGSWNQAARREGSRIQEWKKPLLQSPNQGKSICAKKKVTDFEKEKTNDLKRIIKGELNKMTPENFDKISKGIVALEIDTEERLNALIQLSFDKVVNESIYALQYTELCQLMVEKEVPSTNGTGKVIFHQILNMSADFRKAFRNRPQQSRDETVIGQMRALVMQNCKMIIRELADTATISTRSIHYILSKDLGQVGTKDSHQA
ncbi:hypothetical protein QYM36_008111 [Artemia franciscana]|uniref:MIF4G domain-containing protein n=1 Tax=Artemia franciscana TaxID=6661 RepID=A0AA88IAN8_ARTSF|nr:hypothetical protein QYM36_008111 [Artemia franciscana]